MKASDLFRLLAEAKARCGHGDYVVAGSLSILGLEAVATIPDDMTLSIDADCYTRNDPPRVFDLQEALGEGSPFHVAYGYYLDPISPRLPTLPDGWEARLLRVEEGEVTAHFLEPNDAAVSKLARGEPRDLRWVRAGLRAGLISGAMVRLRMRQTSFLDAAEQRQATQGLDRLLA